MKKLFILVLSFVLQSCAYAPLSNTHSPRTLGKGGVSVQLAAEHVPAARESPKKSTVGSRLGYGIGKNTDLGIVSEFYFGDLLIGGWLKHAFINDPADPTFSVEVSAGGAEYSSYFYVAPMVGYKLRWWESYIIARYNYATFHGKPEAHFHETVIDLSDPGYPADKEKKHYGSITLGNTLWATDWLGLNVNANVTFGDVQMQYVGTEIVLEF